MAEPAPLNALRQSSHAADGQLLPDIARGAVQRAGAGDWQLDADDFWFRVNPPGQLRRVQGWKLHVSATPLAAAVTLARVAPILISHGCGFKFARGLDEVIDLVSSRTRRGSDGKFITAYPDDDEQMRILAPLLDQATEELPGPAVLSDRPLRPGSRVSYRFGAFHGVRTLTNDGAYDVRLQDPQGRLVKDTRRAWFDPPVWAPTPFPEDPSSAAPAWRRSALPHRSLPRSHKETTK